MSEPPPEPPPETAAPRRRPPLARGRKALFLGVVLLGGLLASEGLARLVAPPPPPPGFYSHPYLRRVRAPSSSQALINPLTGEEFVLHVDPDGFRSPRDEPLTARAKPAETYRIFFVGASTTENLIIPDADTFPARVEVALEQRLQGVDVEAINTALSGNSIADSFSLIAHRLTALDPDLIVVLHGINDMRATLSERFDPAHYADHFRPPKVRPKDLLLRYSRLYQLYDRARDRLGGPRLQRERYTEQIRATPYSEGVDPGVGLPNFRRYLLMIADVCRRAEVPLALMTMPTLYKAELSEEEQAALWMGWLNKGELNLSPETLRSGMQLYNDEIRRLAEQEGLLLIDLEAGVPKDLEHLYDDCHYTTQGNARVAEVIVEALLREGKLP